VTRAVVVEKMMANWAEVLRCDDEHFKIPFLFLPPFVSVGWRRNTNKTMKKGLATLFPP